jgi:CheY-specific phosphatase CheX
MIVLIVPALKVLQQFSFKQICLLSPSVVEIDSVEYDSNGTLTLTLNYNSTIQGNSLTLDITPPTIMSNTFAMRSSSVVTLIQPRNV